MMEMNLPTGLLLGAGASRDCGMPLVWELSDQLRSFLTPEHVRATNIRSQALGLGQPEHVVRNFIELLQTKSMHYESIIGNLQVLTRRTGGRGDGQHHHGIRMWFLDLVYAALADRHLQYENLIEIQMRFLDGIVGLAAKNNPLWIFSLNHDLIIECLAVKHNIPINSGFPERMLLPLSGTAPSTLEGKVLRGEMLSTQGLPFFQDQFGINLLKLHGSLDIYQINDGKDYLKIVPVQNSISGVINTLRIVNSVLPYKHSNNPDIRATGSVMYLDENGVLQFLQRSILAGPFKFPEHNPAPGRYDMLSHFKTGLLYVSRIIVIGYGFGDSHVNDALRNWLEFSDTRRIDIVDPVRKCIPNDMLHVAPQVTLHPTTATEFLEQFSSTPLSADEQQLRDRLRNIR
jgi:hypothetical protein